MATQEEIKDDIKKEIKFILDEPKTQKKLRILSEKLNISIDKLQKLVANLLSKYVWSLFDPNYYTRDKYINYIISNENLRYLDDTKTLYAFMDFTNNLFDTVKYYFLEYDEDGGKSRKKKSRKKKSRRKS
jgi:hypothetical protein